VYTVNQIPSTPTLAAGLHLISACLCSARRLEGPPRSWPDSGFNRPKHAPEKGPRHRRLGGLVPADQPRKRGAPIVLPLRWRRAPRRPEVITLWHHKFSFRSSDDPSGVAADEASPAAGRPPSRRRRGRGCHPDSWVTRSQT
jgi:hypothetical protein